MYRMARANEMTYVDCIKCTLFVNDIASDGMSGSVLNV